MNVNLILYAYRSEEVLYAIKHLKKGYEKVHNDPEDPIRKTDQSSKISLV
ncbi:MAG TPA: hypothetical protein VFS97_14580 [Nitrososphaeraceae archaeon]|nr:hypothetical protein [Nitrososphaeraceae archaeon]